MAGNMTWNNDYIICKTCGKRVAVLQKSIWAYKKEKYNVMHYFCSWGCFRAWEQIKEVKKEGPAEMAKKLTLEQKKKAVQIAIDGGNPQAYLKECGCAVPDQTWCYIKKKLKEEKPELYAKIPDGRIRGNQGKRKKTAMESVPVPVPEQEAKTESMPEEVYPVFSKDKGEAINEQKSGNKPEKERLDVLKVKCTVMPDSSFEKAGGGTLMTLWAYASPLGRNTELTLSRDEWYQLTNEIRTALDQMKIGSVRE